MANRILIGKGSTARGTSNYGLWVSRPGKDVTTCTADELIFDTDAGASTDIKGLFQLQNVDTSAATPQTSGTTGSVAQGATVTVSFSNFNWVNGIIPFFRGGINVSGSGSGQSVSSNGFTIDSFNTSSATVTNVSGGSANLRFSVLPSFSANARF